VRRAEFIEDDSDAMARYGARRQLTPEEFGSAQSRFSRADAARLAFAEALIGNFDWCVRFYPGDNYRCDDRHPLWNVLALDRGGSAMPLMYDFDVSGMVVGRHLWFDEIFGHQFAPEASEAEIEVESQLQRTRSLFPRDELDRTRMEFVRHKQAAYEALDASELDGNGRKNIHAYLNAFYDIVEHDDRFDIPVVVDPNARIFQDAAATRPACGSGTIPVGTPVAALERRGRWTRAAVLDALWHWSPPHKCEAVHDGSVWIRSDAVSAEYP
jgi:hypothetical protein